MQRNLSELCNEATMSPADLAARAGVEEGRVKAILEGRWTPSPDERDQIAMVFGLTRCDIAWGHRVEVSHVYGHGPQFGRSP